MLTNIIDTFESKISLLKYLPLRKSLFAYTKPYIVISPKMQDKMRINYSILFSQHLFLMAAESACIRCCLHTTPLDSGTGRLHCFSTLICLEYFPQIRFYLFSYLYFDLPVGLVFSTTIYIAWDVIRLLPLLMKQVSIPDVEIPDNCINNRPYAVTDYLVKNW